VNDLLQVDLMLLDWGKTAKGGSKVVFLVSGEDLEKFEMLTLAKGGRGGQRFMGALAMIADDETQEPLPVGPLCKLAVIWCKDPAFQEWLALTYPGECASHGPEESPADLAKAVLCSLCGVKSRKDLDHTVDGRRSFNELVRRPYSEFLAGQA